MPERFSEACRALIGAASGLGLALLGVMVPAMAEDWPTRPVHIVAPFAPGGATDILGRIFADKLAVRLDQPVIIDNKPGAGGNIGASFVAHAPADGYTLFLASSPGFTDALALSENAGFDPVRDFTPVALLATQSFILTIDPSLPPNDIAEFVAFAKARRGALSYATPGIGTPHHLAMELFKKIAGIEIAHVPFRGGAPMLQAVLGGQIPIMFASYVVAGPYLSTGKLKAIGSTGARRVPQAPSIVPIAEQGYPNFDVEAWFGLAAPTGAPGNVVSRVAREVKAVLAMPDVRERLLQIGFESPPDLSTEAFADLLKSDVVKWSKVVADAGIKPE